ncbi:MAG: ethanolamine utilization protein EutH [Lachnospiraceae bacterium]|nr:ethanolamine utilization protein EutH [Lachnospiraceae bacterium]MBR5583763.1 ethanolamine utilization protein EutH [Lachnospiraceae bacterium]
MYAELIKEITNTEVLTASLKNILENFSANNAIMIIMMIFCVVGGVDKIRGNKLGYGEKFDEAFGALKTLALIMIGIITLVPILKLVLEPIISPIYEIFGASPAMFAGTILPVDSGAYPLAIELANGNMSVANLSGVVLGSTFGCIFIGMIPMTLPFLEEKDYNCFAAAVLVAIITIPLGSIAGGLAMNFTPYKISFVEIIVNLIPVIIISVLVAVGLAIWPKQLMKAFCAIGNGMQVLLTVAVVLAAVQSVTGLRLPLFYLMVEPAVEGGMSPLTESIVIVGTIGLVLSGAFPMVLWITRTFKKPLQKMAGMLGVDEAGGAALVATLASYFPALDLLKEMNQKSRFLVLAFSISATFVLGDHLGFIAGVDPEMVVPMMVSKMISGISALLLANALAPKLLKS